MLHEFKGWVPKVLPDGELIRIPWHMWTRGNPEGTTLKDPRLERAKAFIEQMKRDNRIEDAAALLHDDQVAEALRTIETWANSQQSKTISTSQAGSPESAVLSKCG